MYPFQVRNLNLEKMHLKDPKFNIISTSLLSWVLIGALYC